MDKLKHGKNLSKQRTNTLESVDRQTSQNMEESEKVRDSPTGGCRWMNKSGLEKNSSKQGALTS
jgi:hypothetical protein